MTSKLVEELGIVLKNLRLASGLSQDELARRCGLHRAYVGAVERGEKNITVETAARLTRGLGISLSSLFARYEQLKDSERERTKWQARRRPLVPARRK